MADVEENQAYQLLPVSADQLVPATLTAVSIAGRRILLTRYADELIAFNAQCPHAAADLTDGTLVGERITCPQHGWKFSITSGRALWPPDELCRLRRYPVRQIGNRIYINLDG